jgi:IS4 transposase
MSRARNAREKRASQANRSRKHSRDNNQQFNDAVKWLVEQNIFDGVTFHGNTSWLPVDLIVQALLWIWSGKSTLTEAFDDAVVKSRQLIGRIALSTYQGLAGALETWTPRFMPRLQMRLHELMQEIGGRHFRRGRWLPIAIDGSRVTTPRTRSNEQAFCAKNYGQGKTAKYRKKKTKGMRRRKNERAKSQPQGPQIWVTLMWHIGLGVPWCWKLGPSNSSERAHVMEMIWSGDFLKCTLFVGDAGFVGYEFWKLIMEQAHDFLVRVGGNVRLLQDLGFYCEKGKNGIVYCWPNSAMSKKLPPHVLRLVKCKIGSKKVFLLTSVLDERELSIKEIIRLYKERWGVELEFRGLKQTFERRKLRSHKSARALVEMEWSIFAMTVIELLAVKAQMSLRGADPKKLSFAKSLRAIRQSLDRLTEPLAGARGLQELLKAAVVDDYERSGSKTARYIPNKKDKPSCGTPKVVRATAAHHKALEQLDLQCAA